MIAASFTSEVNGAASAYVLEKMEATVRDALIVKTSQLKLFQWFLLILALPALRCSTSVLMTG